MAEENTAAPTGIGRRTILIIAAAGLGSIFLVTGLCILPSIFRDVFDLRVHKKVISYLSLSPYSKRYMILSFSIVSVVESLIFGFV